MNTTNEPTMDLSNESFNTKKNSNKLLYKAITTGLLILGMLVPTFFVESIIEERSQRQKDVVKEVSSKWANAQTITNPYLSIPYMSKEKNERGADTVLVRDIIILPQNLQVKSTLFPEERPRSIYKVMLYKSITQASGNFQLQLPKEIIAENLLLNEAKVCVGISDFKGIEERMVIQLAGKNYELTPGLPSKKLDDKGLSAAIQLTNEIIQNPIQFGIQMKIKGSEKLYFTPLAANSTFKVDGKWNSPSFDGITLPTERNVSNNGFNASWTFNQASLPFTTAITEFEELNKQNFAFGVNMIQPADQYAKTSRSIKYAILIIGLTFSLFFIIELLQNKPLHPVQYILVGIALCIFYTLLLSIGEFIQFNYAYIIAAFATVALIFMYTKSHFGSWITASIFGSILAALYGFILILIQLEDTALLVGSIGLFMVLALVMYSSRKINWYQPSFNH
ncbi:MAG: cell envelope integrity protein CreD [Chitinophagaceae bacterium]